MSNQINLDAIDVDGAIAETAHDAVSGLESGDTRLDFLKKAGLAGGAVMGGGAVLSALAPGTALAKGAPPKSFGKGDIGILNYALTLEYLESAFYTEASNNQTSTGFIKNAQTKVALTRVTADEGTHVAYLKKAITKAGSKPVASPKFDFMGTTADEAKFTATAFALENEGVHAYSGQAGNISSGAVLKAALSIVTVEARHASVFGLILQGTPDSISPNGAFDTPFKAKRVLHDVKKLHFIQS
jgi:rubrerythrin